MEENDKGELVPVKFWYSDPAELAKVPEDQAHHPVRGGQALYVQPDAGQRRGVSLCRRLRPDRQWQGSQRQKRQRGPGEGKTLFAPALKTLKLNGSEKPETPEYRITAGANGVWIKGSETGLTFRANGPLDKFTGIQVDGKILTAMLTPSTPAPPWSPWNPPTWRL